MAEKFAQCHTMPSFAILFRKSTLNIWRISPVCLRRLRPMPCSLALWCALGQVTGRIIASSLFLSLQPSEWSLQCTKVAHRFEGYLGCTKMHSLMHLVKKWKFIIVCCGKFMDLYSHIRYTFLELQSESEPCKFFHVFGKGVSHHMRDERAWDTQDGALCSLVWRSWGRQELCTNHTWTFRQFTHDVGMLEACFISLFEVWVAEQVMWIPGGDAPGYEELSQLSGGFRRYHIVILQSSGKPMATQWGLDSGRHLDTSISVGAPGSPRKKKVLSHGSAVPAYNILQLADWDALVEKRDEFGMPSKFKHNRVWIDERWEWLDSNSQWPRLASPFSESKRAQAR